MAMLVTGGAGYIGSHTICELTKQGYDDIIAVDNFSNSKMEAIRRTRKLCGVEFPFYEADLRDAQKMGGIFAKHGVDCVIHFAGLKAVGESVAMPLMYYSNNLHSTISLCEVMAKNGVDKLIFSSSATVYSGGNEMPLTEESKVGDCTNPYGWTKFMCEQILTDTAKAHNWSVALLRYFNPIGAHESGDIGEDPVGIPNNIMPIISQTVVGKIECLNVTGNDYPTPDGTGIRDYIHVIDLAKGHVSAIKYLNANKGTHVFNLGTGNGTSVLELIAAFEKAAGVTINRKFTDRRPGDLAASYSSPSKAAQLLNWRAEKTMNEACVDSWRWQSKNPKGYEGC